MKISGEFVDMLCAIVGCIPAAVALWWWHKREVTNEKDLSETEEKTDILTV